MNNAGKWNKKFHESGFLPLAKGVSAVPPFQNRLKGLCLTLSPWSTCEALVEKEGKEVPEMSLKHGRET